jgi:hypothetical protein
MSYKRRLALIRNRNAFNVLLQTNTILLSKSMISDRIGDDEEYVRQMRALASTKALMALEIALRPRMLEKFSDPSKRVITSLIVFIALTLEILLSMPTNGLPPPTPLNGNARDSMHEQLGLLLVHYLHYLCSKVFSPSSSLLSCFGNANGSVTLSESFWSTLASEGLFESSVSHSGIGPQNEAGGTSSPSQHNLVVGSSEIGEIRELDSILSERSSTPFSGFLNFEPNEEPSVTYFGARLQTTGNGTPPPSQHNLAVGSSRIGEMREPGAVFSERSSTPLTDRRVSEFLRGFDPNDEYPLLGRLNQGQQMFYSARSVVDSSQLDETPSILMERWLAEQQQYYHRG